MRHAGVAALDAIEPLLGRIRALGVLKEKSRGCFYFKARGFVHFHEDPAGIFADLRSEGRADDRLPVDAAGEAEILRRVAALKEGA
ncbi:MAG TPA: hypothetical protein VGG29_02295 [Caulobacteraceae bacterium]|jgi:hypothetical protein